MRISGSDGNLSRLPAAQSTYITSAGDTIPSVASKFEVTPGSLAEANNITIESQLQPGLELLIPGRMNIQPVSTGIANHTDGFETVQKNYFAELNPATTNPQIEIKRDDALMKSFQDAMFRTNLRIPFSTPPIVTAPESAPGPQASIAMEEAKNFLGTPYKWGGSTPETGFDASGLMQWAYNKAGIQLPRTAQEQFDSPNGVKVDRNNLRPGDLVAFRDESGIVDHVGMYLGNGKFLHSPATGDVVKISDLNEPYFAKRFAGGVRFDQNIQP
jgi:cell wall-associated NlpC family hydrolase